MGGVFTIEPVFVNSLSAVTATDWTKNLSLHFASKGGSCFIACRRTVGDISARGICFPENVRTRDLNLLSWLDSTGVGADAVSIPLLEICLG